MMSHDEVIKFRVTRSISTCKHIPLDRDKRASKVAGYIDDEIQREKNPDKLARTIRDLQQEVLELRREVAEQKHKAGEGLLGWIRRKR